MIGLGLFLCWLVLKMGTFTKKNSNTSYYFSPADVNTDKGWGQATNGRISLIKSSNSIFEVIMIGFGYSFFSWIGI
jgi:hypothetical protein